VERLKLNEINLPTSKSEGIEHVMPIRRTPKRRKQEPLSETEDKIADIDDPE